MSGPSEQLLSGQGRNNSALARDIPTARERLRVDTDRGYTRKGILGGFRIPFLF